MNRNPCSGISTPRQIPPRGNDQNVKRPPTVGAKLLLLQ